MGPINATTMIQLFHQSDIRYAHYFLILFSSFNSWYRQRTGQKSDALALRQLQNDVSIWHALFDGNGDQSILPVLRKLYVLTQHRSVEGAAVSQWAGRLCDPYDWQGVVWFWYTMRCRLVHGEVYAVSALHEVYVRYAYESLHIFMSEVVRQLQKESVEI